MADDFAKFNQILERINQSAVITLDIKVDVKNYRRIQNLLRGLHKQLTSNISQLALEGATLVQERTLNRMETNKPGPLISKSGQESRKVHEQLPVIKHIIASPPTIIGQGRAGFARKSALDRIKISDKSKSPFVHSWQIAEFGTGRFAKPRVRTTGEYKVPGGGGAWFLNKQTQSPVILGQRGGHFLFGPRATGEFFREEVKALRDYYSKRIQTMLRSL